MKKSALIQQISNALGAAVSLLLGVNECLFLCGLGLLFYGLTGLWSVHGASSVCGGVLIVVSVWGVATQNGKGPK